MGAPVQADVPLPLAQRLARQIEAGGPISVAHYMAEANAQYYNRRDPLGAAGDFTTAHQIRQVSGALVGLCRAEFWIRRRRKDPPAYDDTRPRRRIVPPDSHRPHEWAKTP